VVGEGWHREVSPYPDPCPIPAIPQAGREAIMHLTYRRKVAM
jgi:hypothetical protein